MQYSRWYGGDVNYNNGWYQATKKMPGGAMVTGFFKGAVHGSRHRRSQVKRLSKGRKSWF